MDWLFEYGTLMCCKVYLPLSRAVTLHVTFAWQYNALTPPWLLFLQGWKLSNVLHMQLRMWHQLCCLIPDWLGETLACVDTAVPAACCM